MLETGALGEVAVEVTANLAPLERGAAKARTISQGIDRDLNKVAKSTSLTHAETMKLEQEYRALARSYDPLHAAAIRHQEDLLMIGRLERAGMLAARDGARWRGAATAQYAAAAGSLNKVGQAAGAATFLMRGFVAAIGVGLVTQLSGVVTESIRATAAIEDQARAVGLTTTQYQEWVGVARQLGIEEEKAKTAFAEFAENARQAAAGADREERVFKKLGVSLKDAGGNARSMNDLLTDTIERLGQVHNPLQRGAALAFLFSEAVGPEMAKLVDVGVSKIDELRAALHELGMVQDEETIRKADETAKKLDALNVVLSNKVASTVVENADAILTLAEALSSIIKVALDATSALASFFKTASQPMPQLGGRTGLGFGFGLLTNPAATIGRLGFDFGSGKARQSQPSATVMLPPVASTTEPNGPGIDLSGLFDRDKKPRKGRQPVQNIFAREEAQVAQERLRLLKASTVDLQRRNEIEHELIGWALKEEFARIDRDVKGKRLTAAQGNQLKRQEEANAQLEREAADRQMRIEMEEQRFRTAEELLDAESQMLSASEGLVRTEREKNEIELSILRNKQEQELLEIDKQIAIARQLGDEKRIAELTELRRKAIERQGTETLGLAREQLTGLAKFRDELPQTAEQLREAIDKIRFDRFLDKLQEAARFAEDIGDAFGRAASRLANFEKPLDVLKGLLQDVAQTLTETFVAGPIRELAKQNIGVPLAKAAFGDQLKGLSGLTDEELNMAVDLATGNLNALASAAAAAGAAMGGTGGTAGAADQAAQGLGALDPALAQFGNGLSSILSRLLGGGGGGGLGGLLKLGLGALGSAFGGGVSGSSIGVASQGPIGNWTPDFGDFGGVTTMDFGGGFADGGWIGGRGTGRSDSNLIWASLGEHMTNASSAARFAPLLDGINSGLIPDMPSLGRMFQPLRRIGPSDREWQMLDERDTARGMGQMTQNLYIKTNDADSFRRSERQIRGLSRRRLAIQ